MSLRAAALFTPLMIAIPAHADEALKIGALLPLTGPAAPIGIEEQQGVIFAVEQANAAGGIKGTKIEAIYEDSQGKPDVGVLAFNKLVDLRNVPVIMTAFSSVSLAIAPLATRKKVLAINPGAQSDKLGDASPYLFNTIPLVKDETTGITNYLFKTLGKKTAAIIYENAAAGIDGKDDFKKAFEALGGKILAEEPVEFGQTNYRPTLLKAVSVKPDFIFLVITQGHPTYVEQASQIPGMPINAGTTFASPNCCYPGSAGWYQSSIQSGISPEIQAKFVERFKTKDMPFFSREYFNSTNIAIKAAQHLVDNGKPITGENLRNAILEIKSFGSSVTNINFNNSNTAARGVEIQRYDADARKVIAVVEDTK
jgi:branched-chain amino acid transport system substrate-binding protein